MWDFTDFETDVRKTKNLAAGIEFAAELSERNASFLLQIQLLACRQVFVVFFGFSQEKRDRELTPP